MSQVKDSVKEAQVDTLCAYHMGPVPRSSTPGFQTFSYHPFIHSFIYLCSKYSLAPTMCPALWLPQWSWLMWSSHPLCDMKGHGSRDEGLQDISHFIKTCLYLKEIREKIFAWHFIMQNEIKA